MTWSIAKSFRFEAAHHLPVRWEVMHGHSWVAVVEVRGTELAASGPKVEMLTDYGTISEAVDPLVEQYLDHYDLNQTTRLPNPTWPSRSGKPARD
jgi:6-pyruvoyltetrahydropterin/6-carboxytetrahydropterin synthase